MVGIYKIINPKGRVYVGQSVDIIERWRAYKCLSCKKQPKLYRSLLKYGIEKHKFEILCECDITDLFKLERYYQELYDCISRNGLNCELVNDGEQKKVVSEETRLKISKAGKGRKPSKETLIKMSGREFSKEMRESVSKKNMGRKMSDSAKQKQRLNRLGKKLSNDSIQKRTNTILANGRRIVLHSEYGIFYKSINDASKDIDMIECTLSKKLLGINTNNTPFIYV